MNKDSVSKLRGSIARSTVFKIILYNILAYIIYDLIFEQLFNNQIAELVSKINRELYIYFVSRKQLILIISAILIFIIISYLVIKNSTKYIESIMTSVDKIIKKPEEEITMPSNLALIGNSLNNIRVDLITNKNAATEAEAKKNDLIMYMAHDLKTPLTSIIGYLTLLNDEKDLPDEVRQKYIDIVLKKAYRVEDLTNQFFDITRYNLQTMTITKQKIDLTFLIEQLIEESYPMLQEKKIECIFNKSNSISYMGDGDKLARAFGNLLKNAINYCYENSTIEISAFENENNINIIFKNKGDKIPEYKLEKIFEKFYRGDEARTSKTGGAGLGLAITKEIIELHNGKISVKNDDEYIEFLIELVK